MTQILLHKRAQAATPTPDWEALCRTLVEALRKSRHRQHNHDSGEVPEFPCLACECEAALAAAKKAGVE
jgi:hypothetical protein